MLGLGLLAAGIYVIRTEKSLGRKLVSLAGAVLFGFLPVVPYWLKNWKATGNPVWPLAYSWFGGKDWDVQMARSVTGFHQHYAGLHRGALGILRLPYDLAAHGSSFGVGGPELRWPWIGLGLLALVYAWHRRASWPSVPLNAKVSGMVVGLLIFTGAWFVISPQVRFLLPLFPWALWLAAGAWAALWTSRAGKIGVLLSLGLLLAVHPPIHHDTLLQMKTLAGRVPAEDFLDYHEPHIQACRYLNANMQPKDAVLLFGDNRGFYLEGKYLWGDPLLQKVVDYRSLKNAEDLEQRLRELGVQWILFREDLYPATYGEPTAGQHMREWLQSRAECVFTHGPVKVYRLNGLKP